MHPSLTDARPPLLYSDHQIGHGLAFYAKPCELGLEGVVSKHADAALRQAIAGPSEFSLDANIRWANRAGGDVMSEESANTADLFEII
ncbi:MAG: hypothetical protein WA183_10435, partial [Chthoniobacterales bacterium]